MDRESLSAGADIATSSSTALEPASKKRKVESDAVPARPGKHYENTIAQGSSRVVYGDVISTCNVYPGQQPQNVAPSTEETMSGTQDAAGLIEALQFDEMDDRLATIGAAHADTCQWFFDRSEYKAWRDPEAFHKHNGFLWVKGKPGTGKSTLMKCAYSRGVDEFRDDVVIAFFFIARGVPLQRSTEAMYRSLMCQLLEKVPQVTAKIAARKCRRLQQKGWPLEMLKDVLKEAILQLGPTRLTCYVDALDECRESDASDIIKFFKNLSDLAARSNARAFILLSSRHYPDIRAAKCQQFVLERQEGHGNDLTSYIQAELQIGTSTTALEIHRDVRRKSSGIFLWVVLVVRILNKRNSRGLTHELAKCLDGIPKDLDALFAEILLGDSHEKPYTFPILQWIAFANRPLKREEIYHAVVNELDDKTRTSLISGECSDEDMDRFILDSSRGLAEITRGMQPTVQFIHESVRSYLIDAGLNILSGTALGDLEATSHDNLKHHCLSYLRKCAPTLLRVPTDGVKENMSEGVLQTRQLQQHARKTAPFLPYALDGVLTHAASAHLAGHPQLDFIEKFPCSLWARMYNLLVIYHRERLSRTVNISYILVLKSANTLMTAVIQDGESRVEWNCETAAERHPTLLGLATDLSDLAMLDILLTGGANPDSHARDCQSCLKLTIGKGDFTSACCLVRAGAQIDLLGTSSQANDLEMAVESGNLEIVQLVMRNAKLSFWRSAGYNALQLAMRRYEKGHGGLEIARTLLKWLESFSEECEDDSNAVNTSPTSKEAYLALFHVAILRGDSSGVSLLLDDGAIVDNTAMEQASKMLKLLSGIGLVGFEYGQHKDVLMALFERQTEYHCSDPDEAWSAPSSPQFVNFLLDRGPNILDSALGIAPGLRQGERQEGDQSGPVHSPKAQLTSGTERGTSPISEADCEYSAIREKRVATFFPLTVKYRWADLLPFLLDPDLQIKHRDEYVDAALLIESRRLVANVETLEVLLDWCLNFGSQETFYSNLGRVLVESARYWSSHSMLLVEMILDSNLEIAAVDFCEAYQSATRNRYHTVLPMLLEWDVKRASQHASFSNDIGFVSSGGSDDKARLAQHLSKKTSDETKDGAQDRSLLV